MKISAKAAIRKLVIAVQTVGVYFWDHVQFKVDTSNGGSAALEWHKPPPPPAPAPRTRITGTNETIAHQNPLRFVKPPKIVQIQLPSGDIMYVVPMAGFGEEEVRVKDSGSCITVIGERPEERGGVVEACLDVPVYETVVADWSDRCELKVTIVPRKQSTVTIKKKSDAAAANDSFIT